MTGSEIDERFLRQCSTEIRPRVAETLRDFKNILRAETAAIVGATLVQNYLGEL